MGGCWIVLGVEAIWGMGWGSNLFYYSVSLVFKGMGIFGNDQKLYVKSYVNQINRA